MWVINTGAHSGGVLVCGCQPVKGRCCATRVFNRHFRLFLLTFGLPGSALNFPISSATPMASIADTTCTERSHLSQLKAGA